MSYHTSLFLMGVGILVTSDRLKGLFLFFIFSKLGLRNLKANIGTCNPISEHCYKPQSLFSIFDNSKILDEGNHPIVKKGSSL